MALRSAPTVKLSTKLTTRDFLQGVREGLETRLTGDLADASSRIVFSSLQWHYGDPRLHYEVAPVRKTGRMEIGLHMEGAHDWSRGVAMRLAAHADEIRGCLGPTYELEEWTAAWCRLHQTMLLKRLTDDLAADTADRLAVLVTSVEPILRSLELSDLPGPSAPGRGGPRKKWGRRRRS